MPRHAGWLLVCVLLVIKDASADDWQADTSWRLGVASSDRALNNRFGAGAGSAWLRAGTNLTPVLDLHLEGWVAESLIDGRGDGKMELREARLRWHGEHTDLTLGRQILAWGRADKINPTDILAGRDLTLMFFDDDDQRRGSLTLALDRDLGSGLRWSAYWLPELRPNVLPFRASGFKLEESESASHFDPVQYALKLDHSGGAVDWSLSWFEGLDRTGRLQVKEITSSSVKLVPKHRPLRMVGADAATTWQGYGLRVEVAHVMPHRDDTIISNREREQTFGVVGVDHNLPDDLYANLQAIVRHTWDHVDYQNVADPLDRAIALMNDVRNGQTRATQYGCSFYLKKTWDNETLQADLFSVYFAEGDYLLRPKMHYKLNDAVRISLGAERFRGNNDTQLGALRHNSLVFSEIRYGF
ncbi:MAG: hypothetical protein HQL74_14475 [Magnetococcales bacterium]|nr:hypothetical protein [Magnetococcales bacterium]